jgi:hypothetical protein
MRISRAHNVILGHALGQQTLLSILTYVRIHLAPCGLAHSNNHVGGDWAGNVYPSSGCPGSCVGELLVQNCLGTVV